MGIFGIPLSTTKVTNLSPHLDTTVINDALRSERIYAFIGMLVGALVIGAGIVMIFLNIAGQVDVTINVSGHDSKLNTATVGIPMAVIGALIIYLTRLNVKVVEGKTEGTE
jgi:hypothetical protein